MESLEVTELKLWKQNHQEIIEVIYEMKCLRWKKLLEI